MDERERLIREREREGVVCRIDMRKTEKLARERGRDMVQFTFKGACRKIYYVEAIGEFDRRLFYRKNDIPSRQVFIWKFIVCRSTQKRDYFSIILKGERFFRTKLN